MLRGYRASLLWFANPLCGADSIRYEGEDTLVVATRQPRLFAERVATVAAEGRIVIREVPAGDRSLEGIFGRLVRLHRGVGA